MSKFLIMLKFKLRFFLCLSLMFTLFYSCKNSSATTLDAETTALETEFQKTKSETSYDKLITKYLELIQKNKSDNSLTEDLIKRAASASETAGKTSQQVIFLNNLVKDFPNRADTKESIVQMVGLLNKLNKKGASDVMALAYAKAYPTDSKTEELKKNVSVATSPENYILEIGKAIFADTIKGFSETSAHDYVDACEAYALVLPKDPETPEYINKAAEISNALKTYEKSFALYDWLNTSYSDHKRGQMALFMKAFLFDESLKDTENAKKYYGEFIQKYPNHEFAKQAQLLMDNLGKSQEEVLKNLQEKSKAN